MKYTVRCVMNADKPDNNILKLHAQYDAFYDLHTAQEKTEN